MYNLDRYHFKYALGYYVSNGIKVLQDSALILKKIIQFIGMHRLAAIPVNYTVLYDYFTDIHPSLTQTIDQAITNKVNITNNLMQEWFDTFLTGQELLELSQLQNELFHIAKQLTVVTSQAEGNVSKFDDSLMECQNELEGATDNASLSAIVAMLVNSTSSMQVAMQQMKQQIHSSQQEITSLKSHLEIATVKAITDPLTGLVNRKGLEMAIKQALETKEKHLLPCLLMLDIDHFKTINDTYGHAIGDRAIKLVADTVKNQIKGKDTAARYGGEEFAVLLVDTSLENSWTVAEKIRRMIEAIKIKRVDDQKQICGVTVSIGIAQYQPENSIIYFIEQADIALYQSKNEGRNRTTIFKA